MSIQEAEDFAELLGSEFVMWEERSFTRFPIFLLLENMGISKNSISVNLQGDVQVDVSVIRCGFLCASVSL